MARLNATLAVLALTSGTALAQDAPFGGPADVDYAGELWAVMEEINMVGSGMVQAYPYPGVEPHGMMLETFYTNATVNGHSGELIVKRNYGPEGVAEDEVLMDPAKHLGAVTVMFRREAGYDADNQDWYWVKYLPDGTLDKNPAGMQLAGRVGKGADAGCIACHKGEDDYLFTTDHVTME